MNVKCIENLFIYKSKGLSKYLALRLRTADSFSVFGFVDGYLCAKGIERHQDKIWAGLYKVIEEEMPQHPEEIMVVRYLKPVIMSYIDKWIMEHH